MGNGTLPTDEMTLVEGDRLMVSATFSAHTQLWARVPRSIAMIVVVAGGGRVGAQLASTLLEQGHKVRVIEARREILSHLHRELPTGSHL